MIMVKFILVIKMYITPPRLRGSWVSFSYPALFWPTALSLRRNSGPLAAHQQLTTTTGPCVVLIMATVSSQRVRYQVYSPKV